MSTTVDGAPDPGLAVETITDGRFVTFEMAEWISGLTHDDLPADVVEEAERSFTDFLGECLFVGATQPWGQSIAAFSAAEGGGRAEATIIATGERALASRAAFANGTMALGFEYADYGAGSRPYPFAVTGPLALAETRRRSGRDLVLSIVIGYELMWRQFRALITPGQMSGHYVPAVFGTVASAAGCARMLGLSPQNTNYALGLGCAFAGGSFQGHEEGAWQRSLNGGMAGERGVTAALLAETGFHATELGFEGVQGFAKSFWRGKLDVDALLGGLGEDFIITQRWTKRYPMNTTLHAPVEALLAIMRDHDLDYTDIAEIDAAWQKVEPFLAKHRVSTVVAAQASLPFALSVAAVHQRVGVDQFTEETVNDPRVQGLMPKTVVHQDSSLYEKVTNSMPGRVTVRTTDGRELTAEVLYPKGNPGNRLTEDEFKDKFMDMAVRVLGDAQADELYQRARTVDEIDDVSELAPLFSPKR
jgi:2-methylcitrate dehydratase PrpD